MDHDREFGAKREKWRAANLLPCRLACRITLRRLSKLLRYDDDPYPTRDIDPHEIEMWSEGDVPAFVRRRKMLARSTRSMQHGLASGHIGASCLYDDKFVPVPTWAWLRDDRAHYVWAQNRLLFDALLPDTWARLSRSPVFVDRRSFATWLADHLPGLSVGSLDHIAAADDPPPRIKSRLPAERAYVPLAEALSWLGFGVAIKAEDLYELLHTGEIGDGVDWARERIAQAIQKLADEALAERVRCIGKHRSHLTRQDVPLTEAIAPLKFADYRRYDPVEDGLFYGQGLHWVGEASRLDEALGTSRGDYFTSVQVHRGDLLTCFVAAATQAKGSATPIVAKPPIGTGTLREWLSAVGEEANRLRQTTLLHMARQHFHLNRVTRDQIRELTAGRKRGPKPMGRESTAKLPPK